MLTITSALDFIKSQAENKLALAIVAAVLGAVFTKLIPFLWDVIGKSFSFLGKLAGGHLAYLEFQQRYLDWLVTEHGELRLTGVVSADDAKKPKLEQVFVSLDLAARRQQNESGDAQDPLDVFAATASWSELADLLHLYRALPRDEPPPKIRSNLFGIRLLQLEGFWKSRLGVRGRENAGAIRSQLKVTWAREHKEMLLPVLGQGQLRQALARSGRVAILGAPGAGKTTLLQYLALAFGRERAGDKKLRSRGMLKRRLGAVAWRVPVMLRLSTAASVLGASDSPGKTLIDVIQRTLPGDLLDDAAAVQYFKYRLKRNECLVLLDGLDEVATQQEFEVVVAAIHGFVAQYGQNQFVITSRIAGWRGGVNANFDIFYVNDLTITQISTFVDTWYRAVERNAVVGRLADEGRAQRIARERRAKRKANELKETLRGNVGISHLATNPMLLSIIAVVHRSVATLPHERSKLYSQCSKIFLEQWDISRGIRVDDTGLKLEQKESILRRIAVALHTGEIGDAEGGREVPLNEVEEIIAESLPSLGREAADAPHLLKRLIERSGIIVERRLGILSFAHHTFQEYFTAQSLALTGAEQNAKFLLDDARLLVDWWREVILLFAGLLPDTSTFIGAILAGSSDDMARSRLRLAILALGEAIQVSDVEVRALALQSAIRIRMGDVNTQVRTAFQRETADYLVFWAKGESWRAAAMQSSLLDYKGDLHDEYIFSKILCILTSSEEIQRSAMLTALARVTGLVLPDELLRSILNQFDTDPAGIGHEAVTALARFENPRNVDALTRAYVQVMHHKNGQVAEMAAHGLLRCQKFKAKETAQVFDDVAPPLLRKQQEFASLVQWFVDSKVPLAMRIRRLAEENPTTTTREISLFIALIDTLHDEAGSSLLVKTALHVISSISSDHLSGALAILFQCKSEEIVNEAGIEILIDRLIKMRERPIALSLIQLGSNGFKRPVLQGLGRVFRDYHPPILEALLVLEQLGIGATFVWPSLAEAARDAECWRIPGFARAIAAIVPEDCVGDITTKLNKLAKGIKFSQRVSATKGLGTLGARGLLNEQGFNTLVQLLRSRNSDLSIAGAAALSLVSDTRVSLRLEDEIVTAATKRLRFTTLRWLMINNSGLFFMRLFDRSIGYRPWTADAWAVIAVFALRRPSVRDKFWSQYFDRRVKFIQKMRQSKHWPQHVIYTTAPQRRDANRNPFVGLSRWSRDATSEVMLDAEYGWNRLIPLDELLACNSEHLPPDWLELMLKPLLESTDDQVVHFALSLMTDNGTPRRAGPAWKAIQPLFEAHDTSARMFAIRIASLLTPAGQESERRGVLLRRLEDGDADVRDAAWLEFYKMNFLQEAAEGANAQSA